MKQKIAMISLGILTGYYMVGSIKRLAIYSTLVLSFILGLIVQDQLDLVSRLFGV
jgi:hypothetical protein